MQSNTKRDISNIVTFLLMSGLIVTIHSLGLLITGPFEAAEIIVFENPDDPLNIIYFFVTLLLVTAVILIIAKYWKKELISGIILGSVGITAFYVFYPLLTMVILNVWALLVSITATIILLVALVKYPEWYVIDVCGVVIGAGSIAMIGISLNILLVILLLLVLAVYDAISVYKTKHMIDLADAVLDLKLPVLLVIPKIRRYSLFQEGGLKEKLKQKEKRDAFFLGLGDVIIPGILAVATFHNISNNSLLISIAVISGTLIGFIVLMLVAKRGNPQAGLPYLCGGAILGYVVSSFCLFGRLVGLFG